MKENLSLDKSCSLLG